MAFEQRDGRIDRRLSLLGRRRMVQLGGRDKDWETLFGLKEYQGYSGMSPYWTQKDYLKTCHDRGEEPLKLERIVPYFPMTAEYTYYRKLLEQKNKYRSRFGLPNESEAGINKLDKEPLKLNDL